MNPFDIARKLVALAENGGGTINLNIHSGGNLPTRGYFVGGHNDIAASHQEGSLRGIDVATLAWHIDRFILGKAPYVGCWYNDGKLYIDAVTLLPDLESAKTVGRARGEIAIWDIAEAKEIRL